MKKIVAVLAVAMLISGCASQLHMKKTQESVPGVGVVTALSIESQNGLANNLKVIQTYAGGELTGAYSHGNDGILYPIMSGALQAGGQIGAAVLLRPDETNVRQEGGGATATGGDAVTGVAVDVANKVSASAAAAAVSSSKASAFQVQGQSQSQGQHQGQNQTQWQK